MEVHQQVVSGAGGESARCGAGLVSAAGKVRRAVAAFGAKLARIARDDPRRVAHSLKVGVALTLVSVLYYVRPIFNNWGVSTMWAVLTVVVVMEYTVGELMSYYCAQAAILLCTAARTWRFVDDKKFHHECIIVSHGQQVPPYVVRTCIVPYNLPTNRSFNSH